MQIQLLHYKLINAYVFVYRKKKRVFGAMNIKCNIRHVYGYRDMGCCLLSLRLLFCLHIGLKQSFHYISLARVHYKRQ